MRETGAYYRLRLLVWEPLLPHEAVSLNGGGEFRVVEGGGWVLELPNIGAIS